MPIGDTTVEKTPSQEGAPGEEAKTRRPSRWAVLRNANFRLRWLGGSISVLGDSFYMIALPWLVLQLTGNALAVGTVLALAGVPRALFMLVGGAVTDRLSARTIMLVSNLARAALVALLTALVLTGAVALWQLYALALAFGLVDAFFYPAAAAIMPLIVGREHLQVANSLSQGTSQLAMFVGPALAGLLIAALDVGRAQGVAADVPGREGIGLAFAVDVLAFLFSATTLWLMRLDRPKEEGAAGGEGLWSSIRSGLASVWHDQALRLFFLIVAAINLLTTGPFVVGLPVLANQRYAEGAAALGIVMSAYGGGSLVGTVLAGVLPRPAPGRMGFYLLGVTFLMGIEMAVLGFVDATPLAAGLTFAVGVGDGYAVILFLTWLQARTAQAMQGRIMSLLMFAAVGLSPLSNALTGALLEVSAAVTFVAAGGLLVVIVVAVSFHPAARNMAVVNEPY